jgi:hypothetical protein
MKIPRLRFRNLGTLRARTEELLDLEFVAKIIYGALFVAMLVLTNVAMIVMAAVLPGPLRVWIHLIEKVLGTLLGDTDGIYFILFHVFFTPCACFFVGASGPGLLRRLLYRTTVQPKLDRIYRESHEEMRAAHQIQGCRNFWSRLRQGYSLTLHGLKDLFSPTSTQRAYIMLPSDIDEGSDALSLHGIPSNEEELGDTPGRVNDQNAAEESPRTREQLDKSQEPRERATRSGAKFGTWIGSKVGAAFILPLKAVIRLGELSTELGHKAQKMRRLRLQREERQDLPGDIYLP